MTSRHLLVAATVAGIFFPAEATIPRSPAAETGHAALFVVDDSPEFAAMGGECIKYGSALRVGPQKRLLAVAKGPARSTVIMVAFAAASDRTLDKPTPIVVDQSVDSSAARFPAEASDEVWSFTESDLRADLFIVIGHQDDSRLKLIRDDLESLAGSTGDARLHHAASLRNRLTGLMRSRSSEGGTRTIPSTLAAVRRGLSTLPLQWKEDSDPIAFEKDKPGIKRIKIGY